MGFFKEGGGLNRSLFIVKKRRNINFFLYTNSYSLIIIRKKLEARVIYKDSELELMLRSITDKRKKMVVVYM